MTETKHFDVRGKNISEIVEIAATTIDEIVEESQTNFIIDMQDGGYTTEAAEEVLKSQRASMAAWRKKTLADLEKWLGRDETFNLLSRKQMTPNDMRLAAEAYVRTTCDSGFTVQQLIEYVEKTRADPELILAIRTIAKKHDRKPTA